MKLSTSITKHPNIYSHIFLLHGPGFKDRTLNGIALRLFNRILWWELR